jgi:hypothetical protein
MNGVNVTSSAEIYAAVEKTEDLQLSVRRGGYSSPVKITVSPEVVN